MNFGLQPGGWLAFWSWISRFGQAEVVLPCVLAMLLWMAWSRFGGQAGIWFALLSLAAGLTLATKLAFMGWGIGIASLDFTGISGHALLAAGAWPVLLHTLAARASTPWRRLILIAGFAFAFLVAVSRLALDAHSPSEAAAGFMLGALVSAYSLGHAQVLRPMAPAWLTLVLALWLVVVPIHAPTPRTEGLITRLALILSDHTQPYTRAHLHRVKPQKNTFSLMRASRE